MSPLLFSLLLGCADDPAPRAPGTPPADTGTPAGDDTAADDTAASADDSGAPRDDTGDTLEPCTLGLQVSVGGAAVSVGDALPVGESPAWSDPVVATLTLDNPCEEPLRFLGHPDEWVDGEAFSLSNLPPVYLAPGESASLSVAFTPGDAGTYSGGFSLPYDLPGSPFTVDLTAEATAPLAVVFVGEGRRASTTADYGATFAYDAWETLDAHTDVMQRGGCAGAGTFLSVGGSGEGRWWTSTDGVTWSAHRDASMSWMADCAYGDGVFYAAAGAPMTSTDGVTWTRGSGGFVPNHIRATAWGDGVFVGVGDNGRIATTTAGLSWETDDTPASASLGDVAFGDGVFVAVGAGGTVATSVDGGLSWTEQTVGSGGSWSRVVHGRDGFVIGGAGSIYASPDGIGWSLVNAASVTPIAAVGPFLFGTAGAALHRSDDGGFTWTELRSDDSGPGYADAMVEEAP